MTIIANIHMEQSMYFNVCLSVANTHVKENRIVGEGSEDRLRSPASPRQSPGRA
jgi:hypothetical protein